MPLTNLRRIFSPGVAYKPRPDERPFIERVEKQHDDDVIVRIAVLDQRESERFFGVPLARRGIQPVWLHITNGSAQPYRLRLASLDPNYFSPLEAAFINHFHIGRRILAFGLLAWFFLPLVLLLPFKILSARAANRRMNAYFEQHGIGWGLIRPGNELSGFAFTALDEGTKQVSVRLQGTTGAKEFAFSLKVPGMRVDHGGKRFDEICHALEAVECDEAELQKRLQALPGATMNRTGTRSGDPLNLVVVGDFDTVLTGFGARWDETEAISFSSCWRTFKAFSFGARYRYSPVSPLYVSGRCQDFALQRARQTINERLHLRLWMAALRFQGKPVWIGQISRDIGVRFTPKTWNLTTHRIDPNVDDARDYVLDDLMEGGRVSQVGYVTGVGGAVRTEPKRNLTGDPYFTDGLRAVAILSEMRTAAPTYFNWA
jgi:LssY C-terminus